MYERIEGVWPESLSLQNDTMASTPSHWRIKCNIDGAFYADMGQGATGVVIRDSAGTFIGGRALWYRHGLNALMMEAVAYRDGVILAREMNFRRVQVETDSQELVNLWEMGELQRSSISPIIKDIKDISVFFLDFSLMYANRACNHVAHTLAKQVSDGNRTGEWLLAPSCIANLLTEDCNHDPL
jgi:hypothetical protein